MSLANGVSLFCVLDLFYVDLLHYAEPRILFGISSSSTHNLDRG